MTQRSTPSVPYPLLLEPLLVERIWGGQRLQHLFPRQLPAVGRIGETWESATGTRIVNGPLAGQTLGAVAVAFGVALTGHRAATTPELPFPLLAKFIDAAADLSIQVHPDDRYAREHLGQLVGKTEAWHILDAAPGAVIYHGCRESAEPAELASALARGRLLDYLQTVPVRAGETFFTPAGTIHAIGAGIVLYEIQQYSDVTFRLYDWDRTDDAGRPRELHLEQGLAVVDVTPPALHAIPPLPLDATGQRRVLVACRPFALEAWQPRAALTSTLDGGTFHLLTILAGEAAVEAAGVTLPLVAGQTALIPASSGTYQLQPTPATRLLVSYVPDLAHDIVQPLRALGHADAEIARLGGGAGRGNDLLPYLRLG